MAIVYKIFNKVTGKIYVGWTSISLEERWVRHVRADKKCYIQQCIKKYGSENFEARVLFSFDCNEQAIAKEIELIREWQLNISRHPEGIGMNMTDGGEGTIGYKTTDDHKTNLSYALKGKEKSEAHRDRIRAAKQGSKNPSFGKPRTEKQLESARNRFLLDNPNKKGELSHNYGKPGYWRGKSQPEEVQEKKRLSMKGKNTGPRSDETKAKLRAATISYIAENGHPGLGRKHSSVSREKMRESRIAHFESQKSSPTRYSHSEETKEKMRKAAKYRASRKTATLEI